MEDADIVLDKEIEELALDRPPCSILALGGSDIVVDAIFNDVNKEENDYDEIVSSRLATCLIDKPLSCQDGSFDPLSSSEKNFDVENIVIDDTVVVSYEYAPDASDNDIVEIHSPELVIPDIIHVVSSSTQFTSHQQSTPECKSTNTFTCNKRSLVSCLKGEDRRNADKNKSRCVHFTDEPGIVTEFIEPVNPWQDMRTPSKGEVISFYKNVSQKMKCKPLDKVIKQIQDLSDLSTRSGTLVLRGCRLDNRSCEALESVFQRVQFENLDLENCSLEEDGATAILEMIEFYHSTCKLNIACNPKIGLRGWQALCRMLRKTPCLTYLDARRTILTEMTMPTFGRCLKADPYLKVLHLEGVFLSGRPLLILTTALKYNRLLEELYLGDNDLTSSDGPSLGAMLTYNTTLQLLDLRNNQLKDIGLAHIGNGLSDQAEQPCGGLCSLITWNNGLTHEGMSYLCEALSKTTTLKALNLGQNRIGDLGVQKLKPGLIKNKSLRKLGFLNTKLGSEGAVALAEVLADSWSITRIDIRENNVQTAGLMAFAMALKVNQSLLRLDLDKDIRKEPGMETVMQSVLVDIYNLCYRNKQLVRKNITPSLSTSTHSISTSISRQSSTSSEINEPFSFDDVFHPEAVSQEVIPYSPVTESPVDINNAGLIFSTTDKAIDNTPSTESLGNSISPVFESSKRIRAYSDPVRKNPDPVINERPSKGSRFSVTKILDSIGNHAAGVANKFAQMDNKLKKQHSKDKAEIKAAELMPVLDQNQPIELSQFKSTTEQTNQDKSQPVINKNKPSPTTAKTNKISECSTASSNQIPTKKRDAETLPSSSPVIVSNSERKGLTSYEETPSIIGGTDPVLNSKVVDNKDDKIFISVCIDETQTVPENVETSCPDGDEEISCDNFVELTNDIVNIDEADVIDDINTTKAVLPDHIFLRNSNDNSLIKNDLNVKQTDQKSTELIEYVLDDNTVGNNISATENDKNSTGLSIVTDTDTNSNVTDTNSIVTDTDTGSNVTGTDTNSTGTDTDTNSIVTDTNSTVTDTNGTDTNIPLIRNGLNTDYKAGGIEAVLESFSANSNNIEESSLCQIECPVKTLSVDDCITDTLANELNSEEMRVDESSVEKIVDKIEISDDNALDTSIISNGLNKSPVESSVNNTKSNFEGDNMINGKSFVGDKLNIGQLHNASSNDKIEQDNCFVLNDMSMIHNKQAENDKSNRDKIEDGEVNCGTDVALLDLEPIKQIDVSADVTNFVSDVINNVIGKSLIENGNKHTDDDNNCDININLKDNNSMIDNEFNIGTSKIDLTSQDKDMESSNECVDKESEKLQIVSELSLTSECNSNSCNKIENNSENYDIDLNIKNTSLIEDEFVETKDDEIANKLSNTDDDNLLLEDDLNSEKSEESFLNERLTNHDTEVTEITHINPCLEYVKITDSLNEEKSIYKP